MVDWSIGRCEYTNCSEEGSGKKLIMQRKTLVKTSEAVSD